MLSRSEIILALSKLSDKLAQNGIIGEIDNDSVKGFLSPKGDFAPVPFLNLLNLRVQAPTAQYMLAMKLLAARASIGELHGDAADISFLIRLLQIQDSSQVIEIVQKYYDPSRLLPRSYYLLDEIMESLK